MSNAGGGGNEVKAGQEEELEDEVQIGAGVLPGVAAVPLVIVVQPPIAELGDVISEIEMTCERSGEQLERRMDAWLPITPAMILAELAQNANKEQELTEIFQENEQYLEEQLKKLREQLKKLREKQDKDMKVLREARILLNEKLEKLVGDI